MSEQRVRELLARADGLYKKGTEELKRNSQEGCRLIWEAVDSATRAICLRFLGKEERTQEERDQGVTQEMFISRALRRAGLSEAEVRELWDIYLLAHEALYGACYLGARYDPETHVPIIEEKVPKYLSRVKELLGMKDEERVRFLWEQAMKNYREAMEKYAKFEQDPGILSEVFRLAHRSIDYATRAVCLKFAGKETEPVLVVEGKERTFQEVATPSLLRGALVKAGVKEDEAEKLCRSYLLGRSFFDIVISSRYFQWHLDFLREEVPAYLRRMGEILGVEVSPLQKRYVCNVRVEGRKYWAELSDAKTGEKIGEMEGDWGPVAQNLIGCLKANPEWEVKFTEEPRKGENQAPASESAEKVRILKVEVVQRYPPEKIEEFKSFEPFRILTIPEVRTRFEYKGKEYEARSLGSEGREGVLAAIAKELEKEQVKRMFEWDEKKLEEIRGLEGKEIDLREVLAAGERIKRLSSR
jgi:hypothetical protein